MNHELNIPVESLTVGTSALISFVRSSTEEDFHKILPVDHRDKLSLGDVKGHLAQMCLFVKEINKMTDDQHMKFTGQKVELADLIPKSLVPWDAILEVATFYQDRLTKASKMALGRPSVTVVEMVYIQESHRLCQKLFDFYKTHAPKVPASTSTSDASAVPSGSAPSPPPDNRAGPSASSPSA